MRLIMAVSADGYFCRTELDDMRWLGPTDKAVFRMLTGVGRVLGVGYQSYLSMPSELDGRKLLPLSAQQGKGWGCLAQFERAYPDGWLLGGPTLAKVAFFDDLLTEVHLCKSNRFAFPTVQAIKNGHAKENWLSRALDYSDEWALALTTPVGDVTVQQWRKKHGAGE